MSTPVSNTVQGGYLVAIFFTSAIFGGLALVFWEITEGLGCLLGGFCIGMWLLTLKSGGLVTGTGARAGLIIAFTVAFYCLAFSHYTRSYGLILCTAFSGATSLVLGIDCFSRAGLKEFWLYLWGKSLDVSEWESVAQMLMDIGLNEDMFPLNTYTYPVTRGIKVEIAVIVIVAVFGVIAQLRLWKVIKERRVKEQNAREEAERNKDAAEVEIGRRLEKKNDLERAEWEHVYGHRHDAKAPSQTETAVADESRRSSGGCSGSAGAQSDSFEMKDLTQAEHSACASDGGKPLETVEEVTPDDVNGSQTQQIHVKGSSKMEPLHQEASQHASFVSHEPFDTRSIPEDDDSEHGAVMGSEIGTPRSSERFSRQSWRNRLSWRSGRGQPELDSQSEEALVVLDDASSSVAGVVDDLESVDPRRASIELDDPVEKDSNKPDTENEVDEATVIQGVTDSPAHQSPHQPTDLNAGTTGQESHGDQSHPLEAQAPDAHGDNKHELGESNLQQSGACNKEDKTEDDNKENNEEDKNRQAENPEMLQAQSSSQSESTAMQADTEERETTSENRQSFSTKPDDPAAESSVNPDDNVGEVETGDSASQIQMQDRAKRATLDMTTVQSIPEQTSKVVHNFRTKEWAKHLTVAEVPELEPLRLERETEEDSTEMDEPPAPVNVDGLLQTAFNSQPPPVVNSQEQDSPNAENRQSYHSPSQSPRISRPKSRMNVQDVSTPKSSQPQSLPRSLSSASVPQRQEEVNTAPPMQRSTSTPFLTVTRPPSTSKEEDTANIPRWSGTPPLLAIRQNKLRNRMSSTSPRYDPWSTRSQSRQSYVDSTHRISPTLSIPEERDEDIEELQSIEADADDIPLSRRRALLQRQTMRSPSTTSQHSYERANSPQWSPVGCGKSSQHMATWRQSIQEDLQQKRDPLAYRTSSSPVPVSPDQPRSMWGSVQQLRDASATHVDNAVAEGMQRGSMTDLHRQAMRRMQASANRQL